MRKYYVDFDGVICDTVDNLLQEYREKKKQGIDLDEIKYIHDFDWEHLLEISPVINDAIDYINGSIYDVSILTKVHSLNEAYQKIKFLRSKDVVCDIIIVPSHLQKSEVINPDGAILIDDQMRNLQDWYFSGGECVFFNKDGHSYDSRKEYNYFFPTISDLSIITNRVDMLARTK